MQNTNEIHLWGIFCHYHDYYISTNKLLKLAIKLWTINYKLPTVIHTTYITSLSVCACMYHFNRMGFHWPSINLFNRIPPSWLEETSDLFVYQRSCVVSTPVLSYDKVFFDPRCVAFGCVFWVLMRTALLCTLTELFYKLRPF